MAVIYVTACLIVIFANLDKVPGAIGDIITGAFNPTGVAGGVVGVVIVGFQRAAFSNEAGLGSAAIAHSPVKTRRPVSEGFVALLEPFIDTVIICTMTALTIIIAAPTLYTKSLTTKGEAPPDGVVVTSEAFETVIPDFPVVLAVAVALFAFSTLITWSYYGLRAWTSLFGRSAFSENLFKFIFCLFTVTGSVLTFDQVLGFADSMLFLCAFVNLFGVYLLMPVVKREMKEYLADRKSGELSREAAEPPPAKYGAGA
jgi:AGCS family alanine or glycine:cation symporter